MTDRIFVIADKQGRPTMRTRRQDKALFMQAQGWTVVDVLDDPNPPRTTFASRAAARAAEFDNRNLCNPALGLGTQ